jgi:peptidoglycan/LPS O-acetylase OafA/YrhL
MGLKRLYSLDALRGVAALAVVVWHWQHFFAVSGTWQEGWQRDSQPLYWLLKPLYLTGWAAVDLFFALSGFVFFWLYSQAIRERTVGAGKFALLRFSRLYPLFFATLIAALGLQTLFHRVTGTYFIFPADDWGRFTASLLMAQQWLPPTTDQFFNGPAWSVSIEVLLYGVFFLLCRAGLRGPKLALLVSLCGVFLMDWNGFIARGICGYFIGGAAYFATEKIKTRADAKSIARAICVVALLLWGILLVETLYGPLHSSCYWLAGHISPEVGRFYSDEEDNIFLLLFIYTVSPLTIMGLALHEQVLGGVYTRLHWLGDVSYSTYMLHFPLQIACAVLALHFAVPAAWFQTDIAMVLFYAVLIGLGLASYRFFERPMQNLIRTLQARLSTKRAAG